jgi:hypothetical protein
MDLKTVHMSQLQQWIDTGRLDATKPINVKALHDAGCVKNMVQGVYLSDEVKFIL